MLTEDPRDDTERTLTADQLERLRAYGTERETAGGELLFVEGQEHPFVVVFEGRIDLVRRGWDTEAFVASVGPGGFLGELSLLTGRNTSLAARVAEDGRIVLVDGDGLRRLLASETDLADTILAAFMARRARMGGGEGAQSVQILGSRFSPETLRLLDFATRSRVPHHWVDLDEVEEVDVTLARWGVRPVDAPVVITPTRVMRRPTPGELADYFGVAYRPVPGHTFDLVVVGAGPAGLAAAVYGASEGLDVVVLDAIAAGGQAGASSRIENYLGFPQGVTGAELAARAEDQAVKFGARINAPCEVGALAVGEGFHLISLRDGSEIPARAVLVATGAHYRRLPLEGREELEGAGVYYAATALEANTCARDRVVVVGGGNSAGQAALYLAGKGATVEMAVRGPRLDRSMSRYLVSRVESHPGITVRCGTVVSALHGRDGHLAAVDLEGDGAERELACRGLFCFIGVKPATAWLSDSVARDRDGFVLTGPDVADGHVALPFETSVPGVFAAGDCRHGSIKRVAAAVGEGSSALRSVHQRMAAQP